MSRIILAIFSLFALSSLIGCTTCSHRAVYDSLAIDCPHSACGAQRSQVVAVVFGTESMIDVANVRSLTRKMNESGFARVYHGGILHEAWIKNELITIHKDDPETRFVIIGYDLGTRAARQLTAALSNINIHVDSLVLLDPIMLETATPLPEHCELTVVRSHGWKSGVVTNAVEMQIPGVGHIDLPNHADTLGYVLGALNSAAERVPVSGEVTPKERPAHLGSEWDFILGPSNSPSVPETPKTIPERTAIAK